MQERSIFPTIWHSPLGPKDKEVTPVFRVLPLSFLYRFTDRFQTAMRKCKPEIKSLI